MILKFDHLKLSTLCAVLAGASACDGVDANDAPVADGHEPPVLDAESRAAARDAAILESLEFEPSASVFEYTGDIRDPDARWRRGARAGRVGRPDVRPEGNEADSDLVDILTRDGRTYQQRMGTQTRHTGRTSRVDTVGFADAGDDDDVESVDVMFRQILGDDTRQRVTSSSTQGVMVKMAATSSSSSPGCSASMIAPRVFLTAAHCVTDDNGDWDWGGVDWVMPAARGRSYSGSNTSLDADDTPFGAREVVRVLKPSDWSGTGAKYDYAVLVIGDVAPDNSGSVQWVPAPVQFANQDCDDLEGTNVNLRGYPGRTLECADASPEDDGECGGFAYSASDPIDECTSEALFYYIDSDHGQSGAPIYRFSSNSGVRTVVGVHRGPNSSRNWGHKIRSGSYGLICDQLTDPENLSSYFDNPSC
jgi:V8-like Glu-specific endopeptidase